MTTNTPSIWDSVFPSIPSYAIPSDVPSFSDAQSLIEYVRANTGAIADNWTDAIRQKGVQGRLMMMQDNSRDEESRFDTIFRAIRLAQSQLINQ